MTNETSIESTGERPPGANGKTVVIAILATVVAGALILAWVFTQGSNLTPEQIQQARSAAQSER